jgi:hypothetical protein
MLDTSGENLELYPVIEAADIITWGDELDLEGIVQQGAVGELTLEPGYMTENHITVHSFLPVRVHDKIRRFGEDYEILTVQVFDLNGEPQFYKSSARRLVNQ